MNIVKNKNSRMYFTLLIGILIISTLSVVFGFQNGTIQTNKNSNTNNHSVFNLKQTTYQSLQPLIIDGNTNFTSYGIFTGIGTINQPYMLNNQIIQANGITGISISNTDKYFIISNVLVNNSSSAFYLKNVTNGQISNCNASSSTKGFYVGNSHNINFTSITTDFNYYGIYLSSSYKVNIENSSIQNDSEGVYLKSSSNNTITNNEITNSTYFAVDLYQPTNKYNIITNNLIVNNLYGIQLGNSANNNLISGNTLGNNENEAIYLQASSNYNIITNNTCYNNFNDVHLDKSDFNVISNNTFSKGTNPSLRLFSAQNNEFYNNIIQESHFYAIWMTSDTYSTKITSHNLFVNNTAINSRWDMFKITESVYNIFENNTAINTGYNGFSVDTGSDNNQFINNSIRNNGKNGFFFSNSNNSTITGNIIINSVQNGINLLSTNNTTVTGNTITYNNQNGLYASNTNNSTFLTNRIQGNNGYGFNLDTISENNTIKQNDIIQNNNNERQSSDNGTNNTFSQNYWLQCFQLNDTYYLDGQAGSVDKFPSLEPIYSSSFNYMIPCIKSVNNSIVTYEEGSNDTISLVWMTLGYNASTYLLLQNGVKIEDGLWNNGTVISYDVKNIANGRWNYTLVVLTTFGKQAKMTTILYSMDTIAPNIVTDLPQTFNYTEGTKYIYLSLNVTDLNPGTFIIYQNGTEVRSEPWLSGITIDVLFDLMNMSVGTYNITVVVKDINQNSVTTTCFVTVEPQQTTTSTKIQETTSKTSSGSSNLGWNPIIILLSLISILLVRFERR